MFFFLSEYGINEESEQPEQEDDDGRSEVISSRAEIGLATTFLKEYPFMSWWYYWNVLTIELRTIMLQDVTRVKYNKVKTKESKSENVITVGSVEDLM